jgi:hypothetical protein
MPFDSVPTAAKRNSFNPDRRKAKASVLGILNSQKGLEHQTGVRLRCDG